jgi:hypothetical protein
MSIAQDGEGNVTLSVPSGEEQYWSPVTAYDYEEEQNAQKANIKLLDSKLVNTAVDNIKQLLSE